MSLTGCVTAQAIIAEVGLEMRRFPTASDLGVAVSQLGQVGRVDEHPPAHAMAES